jgi:hypothetical protein
VPPPMRRSVKKKVFLPFLSPLFGEKKQGYPYTGLAERKRAFNLYMDVSSIIYRHFGGRGLKIVFVSLSWVFKSKFR